MNKATETKDTTFQSRVDPWLMACFGQVIARDETERNHRFIEEALELVQSTGCTQSEAHQLVDYVFGRDIGKPPQEVGGVMVTLAALCLAQDMDMHAAGEVELRRIWTKVEAIRAKQKAKPKHSPLPITGNPIGPVQQEWVLNIPFMQQSVLFAAVRAPDGIRKNHPVKVLMRWYRRCVLLSAFDQKALTDPFSPGGGSFTGPFTPHHCRAIYEIDPKDHAELKDMFDGMRGRYLEYVDELPHHFQLHLMHAAQIIGVHHPEAHIAKWWWLFYLSIVNDAHLKPETPAEMNTRLSDNREEWLRREVVTAE